MSSTSGPSSPPGVPRKVSNASTADSGSAHDGTSTATDDSGDDAVDSSLRSALVEAFRSGVAGSAAQSVGVISLMWLRTVMNYQHRFGGTTKSAAKALYNEGGLPRFYRGLIPALIQAPLSRFGDTAANTGVLALLNSNSTTQHLPIGLKTALCSGGAGAWRLCLMPVDAWKTSKQVFGPDGLSMLLTAVKEQGVRKLWHGSAAAVASTWVGHYPWFLTNNALSVRLPEFTYFKHGKYMRRAFIGFCSSLVSDSSSNFIRVIKTTKQTSKSPMTYVQAAERVVAQDGLVGLFGRGLKTRLLANGIQGMCFNVLWKSIQAGNAKQDRSSLSARSKTLLKSFVR